MGLIQRKFHNLYWRLTHWVAPGLVNAQRPYFASLVEHLKPDTAWLDLGCGRRLIPSWLPEADLKQAQLAQSVAKMVGMDLDLDSITRNNAVSSRIVGRSDRLPFENGTFDLITANMVVEHLDDPISTLAEVSRILKPGGIFLFHTPNIENPLTLMAIGLPQWCKNWLARLLENRAKEDVFPTFYRLNREATIRQQAIAVGLDIDRVGLIVSSPETVMLGPIMIFEMLLIRLTRWSKLRRLRSNIIVGLSKPLNAPAKATATPLKQKNQSHNELINTRGIGQISNTPITVTDPATGLGTVTG